MGNRETGEVIDPERKIPVVVKVVPLDRPNAESEWRGVYCKPGENVFASNWMPGHVVVAARFPEVSFTRSLSSRDETVIAASGSPPAGARSEPRSLTVQDIADALAAEVASTDWMSPYVWLRGPDDLVLDGSFDPTRIAAFLNERLRG